MEKEGLLKQSLKKRTLVFVLILFLCIPLLFSQIAKFRLNKYEKDSIPYTNDFLNLLIGEKYAELYEKYASDSNMDLNEFKEQIKKIDSKFGVIRSHSYSQMMFSQKSMFGGVIGFFLTHRLEFDNGKSYTATFSIDINEETNKPIIGKLFNFKISGDFGEKHVEIRLINHRKHGGGSMGVAS